jgi:hypothetical protein
MKKNKILITALVIITYLGMIIVNGLANALPIGGRDTGQISNNYPNLFAPTGLTFAIWGLIYLLLAGYTIYQSGLFQKDHGASQEKLFQKVNIPFIISSLANIAWIFAWHYQIIPLSVILILVILISLIKIANILRHEKLSLQEKLLVRLPFSLYFGWITIATIANITILLVSLGWNGGGIAPAIWTIIILLIGAAIGSIRTIYDQSVPYGLVLIWAYLGIWLKHTSATGFNGQYPDIITTLILCLAWFIGLTVGIMFKKRGQLL